MTAGETSLIQRCTPPGNSNSAEVGFRPRHLVPKSALPVDRTHGNGGIQSLNFAIQAHNQSVPGSVDILRPRVACYRYFEGIDSERGIAWRAADSLGLRSFLGVGLNQMPPDHSTISRMRRLIVVETHKAVFRWVPELLAEKDLLQGKTVGMDATTLEAGIQMRVVLTGFWENERRVSSLVRSL